MRINRLKKIMQQHGVTQTQLSEMTGITVWMLQAAMQDKRSLSWENYVRVCEALECKLWDILDDEKMELLKKITQWI